MFLLKLFSYITDFTIDMDVLDIENHTIPSTICQVIFKYFFYVRPRFINIVVFLR